MKQSFFILTITGLSAIAAMLLAWVHGGKQEDVACAIGGVVGLAIANVVVIAFLTPRAVGESDYKGSPEIGFAYGVFAMAYFAFVGWLTGYLHGHGDFAGTVCGGLGGFILAVIVPAIHRSPFMALGRKQQFALSVLALGALLRIVWVMYLPEFIY
jgi:hypothetical protein